MKVSLSPAEFWELILSHHPDMPCFYDDVVILWGRRICAGCLFAYPTALFVLLLLHPYGIESIIIALALAVISLVRKLIENRYTNFFLRFVAGLALGYGIGGLIWALQNQQYFFALLIILGGCCYGAVKFFSMKRKISEWEKCS
jgi:hypothetical protein